MIHRKQLIIVLFILILLFIYVIISVVNVEALLQFLTVFFFFTLLCGILYKMKEKPPLIIVWILLLLFFVKSIYAYTIYETNISPFPDSLVYLFQLEQMKESNITFEQVSHIAQSLHVGYHYFMYFILLLFKTIYGLYIANVFLFSISALLLYRILKKDFGNVIAQLTTFLFLCSMNMFLFTSNILKDSLVLFLLLTSLYVYRFSQYKLLTVIPILLLFTVRIYAGAAVALGIIAELLLTTNMSNKKKLFSLLYALSIVIVLQYFSFSNNYLNMIVQYLQNISLNEIVVLPVLTIFKFYFSPLIWNLTGNQDVYLITFIDSSFAMVFSFSLLLFVIKYCKYKDLRMKLWLYVIPIVIHALALGVELGGASDRQRIGIFGFIILTFVIGLFYRDEREYTRNPLFKYVRNNKEGDAFAKEN